MSASLDVTKFGFSYSFVVSLELLKDTLVVIMMYPIFANLDSRAQCLLTIVQAEWLEFLVGTMVWSSRSIFAKVVKIIDCFN